MNNIQSNQSNSWLICNRNMCFAHIESDLSQIAWVFLEHTHPASTALSSSRELSMQGYALLVVSLAGRCVLTINSPAAVSLSPRPTYFLTTLTLADGWLDANHKSVGLVLLGKPLDGGSRKRIANFGKLSLLQIAGAICLLSGRHKFALGKHCSSFNITCWLFLTRSATNIVGDILMLLPLGWLHSALLRINYFAERCNN